MEQDEHGTNLGIQEWQLASSIKSGTTLEMI